MGRKKLIKEQDSGMEEFTVKKIVFEEIDYELDAADSELIKYEFNMIELPFFTKDKKVKDGTARKYLFSKKDNCYMSVIPSGDPGLISNKIPQEFDEKIFYGILKLSNEQNDQEVITDYFTLAAASGVHYKNLERIKDSIERLRSCTFELQNTYYNAALKVKVKGKEFFPILQHVRIYTFDQILEMPEEKQDLYKKYFRNSKISEILILTFSNHMYKNVQKKGFLYFNQKDLLGINNATARKLYLLITKWHGWEKNYSMKRSCRFIASRIPLSWETKNVSGTIKYIESSCELLASKGLIKGFSLIKTKPLSNSYLEFVFDSNGKYRKIEQYNTAQSVLTGHENISIEAVEDEIIEDLQTNLFDAIQDKKPTMTDEERLEALRQTEAYLKKLKPEE